MTTKESVRPIIADPASTTPTRGEVGQCAAMRAAATVVPTVGREGRSGAVSAAAGAAGESSESSFENINGNTLNGVFFIFEKEKL